MAETPAILGQLALSTSLADLYTVGASTSVVTSVLVICNRSATATTFTVTAAPGGAADANAHQLFSACPIGGNDTAVLAIPMTLAATDKVRAKDGAGTCSATLFGVVNS